MFFLSACRDLPSPFHHRFTYSSHINNGTKTIKRQFIILVFPQISIYFHFGQRKNGRMCELPIHTMPTRIFACSLPLLWCVTVSMSCCNQFPFSTISILFFRTRETVSSCHISRGFQTRKCILQTVTTILRANKYKLTVHQPEHSELAKERTD